MYYEWKQCQLAGPMAADFSDREIGPLIGPDARPAPPADVLSIPHQKAWRHRVWLLVSDVVTEEVKQAVIDSSPEWLVSDDLSWLNEPIFDVTGQDVNIKSLLADRLSTSYRALRAAHATRVSDLSPFYTQGLRPLDPADFDSRAKELFVDDPASGGSLIKLNAAIAEVNAHGSSGARAGWLYFCADERELIRDAGHYLVYGSEYLYCLGIRTTTTSSTKRIMKSVGRPTMLVCDIPMDLIGRHTLEEFSGVMLEAVFNELLGLEGAGFSGSALSLQGSVPARCVVGHYHPETVKDPLFMT